jgi:very-short-patch-repair endonuclease
LINSLPTENTAQEKIVAKYLDTMGLRYGQQIEFGPYKADFYLPEIGWVIEADGIYGHLKKADKKRDEAILKDSRVSFVLHVKSQTKSGILDEIDDVIKSLLEEMEKCLG